MQLFHKVFSISCITLLLAACGDDLNSLPDPQEKAPGIEPDSFSFETATDIDLTSISFNASIYSSVPASTTRYYQFTLEYFDVGRQETLTLSSASDTVTLSWYGPDQQLKASSGTSLDFSSIDDEYYTECCDGVFTFYFSVENASNAEVDYQITFN